MSLDGPASSIVVKDDDSGCFRWLDDHPDGFFVHSGRSQKPGYLVLHRSGCPQYDRAPSIQWTRNSKTCCTSRSGLTDWAAGEAGGDPTPCGSCFG